jgi:phosphoserine phosphatase
VKKYILCCVSRKKFSEEFVHSIKDFLTTSGAEILGKEEYLEDGLRAFDLSLNFPHDFEKIKFQLMDLSNLHQVDMALIPESGRSNRKLIVFDMDSTLIKNEVIVEMAMEYGVGEQVKEITERAMNGQLNFDQALRERVALLKGFNNKSMELILSRLKLTDGVSELIEKVQAAGYKTAIVSGGFEYFAEHFKKALKMDYSFANTLDFQNGALTGNVTGTIINAQAKSRIVEELAVRENISLDQVVAVGDGANDLLMLAKAGFGIAFHAKEKVRREARHQMSHGPMTTLLYFLGIPGNHLNEII